MYRLQQLLFIYCLYICVVVYAAFQANKVIYSTHGKENVRHLPENGKEEHDKRVGEMEVEPEEANDEVSECHSANCVERVLDVGRSKQAQDERDGVLGATKAEFYHVHESAMNTKMIHY